MTDAGGTTTRAYDAMNRVIQKTVPTLGVTTYQYDLTTGVTGLTTGQWAEKTTDPKGGVTTRIYDKAGRMIQVDAGGQIFTYTYNNAGLRTKVTYPGGVVTENYTYNNDQRLTSIQSKKSAAAIKTDNYTYDAAHNPIQLIQWGIYPPLNQLMPPADRTVSARKPRYTRPETGGNTPEAY